MATGIVDELGWNSVGFGDLVWVMYLFIVSEGDDLIVVEVCLGYEVVVGNVYLVLFLYGFYDVWDDFVLIE